jgi:hypothetical protein
MSEPATEATEVEITRTDGSFTDPRESEAETTSTDDEPTEAQYAAEGRETVEQAETSSNDE